VEPNIIFTVVASNAKATTQTNCVLIFSFLSWNIHQISSVWDTVARENASKKEKEKEKEKEILDIYLACIARTHLASCQCLGP